MQQTTLPNGLEINTLSKLDAHILFREIYSLATYNSHGITIKRGDCVFDIGANIGFYSVYVTQNHEKVKLFAFEPIPEVFRVLQSNTTNYAGNSEVNLFNIGLAAQSGEGIFEYSPYTSMTTTMRRSDYMNAICKETSTIDWLKAGLIDLHKIGQIFTWLHNFLQWALTIPILQIIVTQLLLLYYLVPTIRNKLLQKSIICPLKTLSQVIQEHEIDVINLLKIDVEGSEAEIINGIEDEDWSKIQQMVIEVHDVNGRVEILKNQLEEHGYKVEVYQEDWEFLKLLGNFILYAIKA